MGKINKITTVLMFTKNYWLEKKNAEKRDSDAFCHINHKLNSCFIIHHICRWCEIFISPYTYYLATDYLLNYPYSQIVHYFLAQTSVPSMLWNLRNTKGNENCFMIKKNVDGYTYTLVNVCLCIINKFSFLSLLKIDRFCKI